VHTHNYTTQMYIHTCDPTTTYTILRTIYTHTSIAVRPAAAGERIQRRGAFQRVPMAAPREKRIIVSASNRHLVPPTFGAVRLRILQSHASADFGRGGRTNEGCQARSSGEMSWQTQLFANRLPVGKRLVQCAKIFPRWIWTAFSSSKPF